jgi:ClpP class serine protease
MDYYSILGPIDPQMDTREGYMPGMGYLAKFNELMDTINTTADAAKTRAEMAYLGRGLISTQPNSD